MKTERTRVRFAVEVVVYRIEENWDEDAKQWVYVDADVTFEEEFASAIEGEQSVDDALHAGDIAWEAGQYAAARKGVATVPELPETKPTTTTEQNLTMPHNEGGE